MVSGRPFISTTTYGLPVAAMALTSASCCPGRPILLREDASPVSAAGSPTDDDGHVRCPAALTAAPNPVLEVHEVSQPCA